MSSSPSTVSPTVLTVDAGGTSFRFAALRDGRALAEPLRVPTPADDLPRCLAAIRQGFASVLATLDTRPAAISFAFPGPAVYADGIIGDLPNVPAFRGGVALGPMLEDAFGLPVLIANDGDLFALGEAMGGLLPEINRRLDQAGSRRRYRHLLGLTLGTGTGGGLSLDGRAYTGTNGQGVELWTLRDHRGQGVCAEETLSIRGIRRLYAAQLGIAGDQAPEPRAIADLVDSGDGAQRAAATAAWTEFGTVLGDLLADLIPVVDAPVVLGGGLSQAYARFAPALFAQLRARRLSQTCVDLETAEGWGDFTAESGVRVPVPGSTRTVPYEPRALIGIGRSRLGTSEAIWWGAYAAAVDRLRG